MSKNKDDDVGFCIFCDEIVYREDLRYLPLDRPIRLDLPVHKSCLKKYEAEGTAALSDFISQTLPSYLMKYSEDDEHVKKKRKDAKRSKKRDYEWQA